MALIMKKRVKFDGVPTEVTLKFNHWLPKFIKVGGMAIGKSCYFPRMPEQTALILIAHELIHTHDFLKKAVKIPGGYIIDVIGDLLHYLWQWICAGFRYRTIKEEQYAYTNEYAVLRGTYETIDAEWLSIRYNQGFQALPAVPGVSVKS
jgi:hypothetical protein